MSHTILGLLGRAGSGKTTVANHLVERYGAQRYSFAAPLKKMAGKIWDFSEEQLYGTVKSKETIDPRHGITSRWAMQTLGETAREFIGPDVWIQACLHAIHRDCESWESTISVIDDVRHVNEAAALAALDNAFVFKLIREGDALSDAKFAQHPSEAQVDLVEDRLLFATIRASVSVGAQVLLSAFDTQANPILQGRRHPTLERF